MPKAQEFKIKNESIWFSMLLRMRHKGYNFHAFKMNGNLCLSAFKNKDFDEVVKYLKKNGGYLI